MAVERPQIKATSDAVIADMLEAFHPDAAQEIQNAMGSVRAWLEARFKEIGVADDGDMVEPALNDYNVDPGVGLQSYVVRVVRAGEPLRFSNANYDEYKDPTIGVIAKGMVAGSAGVAVKAFAIQRGFAEGIMVLSQIRVGDEAAAVEEMRTAGTYVSVVGQNSAHVVVEASTIGEGEETNLSVVPGVYACHYYVRAR